LIIKDNSNFTAIKSNVLNQLISRIQIGGFTNPGNYNRMLQIQYDKFYHSFKRILSLTKRLILNTNFSNWNIFIFFWRDENWWPYNSVTIAYAEPPVRIFEEIAISLTSISTTMLPSMGLKVGLESADCTAIELILSNILCKIVMALSLRIIKL